MIHGRRCGQAAPSGCAARDPQDAVAVLDPDPSGVDFGWQFDSAHKAARLPLAAMAAHLRGVGDGRLLAGDTEPAARSLHLERTGLDTGGEGVDIEVRAVVVHVDQRIPARAATGQERTAAPALGTPHLRQSAFHVLLHPFEVNPTVPTSTWRFTPR